MREILVVVVAVLLLVGLGYGIQFIANPNMYEDAWLWMIWICSVAVLAEFVYFTLLYASLKLSKNVPHRWYARSFEHHKLLSKRQRKIVMPFFYIGVLGLLVSLTIAVLLAFASFGIYRSL